MKNNLISRAASILGKKGVETNRKRGNIKKWQKAGTMAAAVARRKKKGGKNA